LSYYEEEYGYKVDLEAFSGPLDLLLYLIREDEVAIADIPISRITDQYLAHIEALQAINMNLAGEFLLMAATLMEIKSRMLLPRPEQDEEAPEDPRADLIRQLLEYKRFKDAARQLARRSDEQALKSTRGLAAALGLPEREPEEDLPIALGEVTAWDLLAAFKVILRQTSLETMHRIVMDEMPASFYCNELLDKLRGRPNVLFRELLDPAAGRLAVISGFLALLELIRRRRVRVEQVDAHGEIRILLLDDTPVSESELAVVQRPPEPAPAGQGAAEVLVPESPVAGPQGDEAAELDAEVDGIAVPEVEARMEGTGLAEEGVGLGKEGGEPAGGSPAVARPRIARARPVALTRLADADEIDAVLDSIVVPEIELGPVGPATPDEAAGLETEGIEAGEAAPAPPAAPPERAEAAVSPLREPPRPRRPRPASLLARLIPRRPLLRRRRPVGIVTR
jgi:segregation and condensation protein A